MKIYVRTLTGAMITLDIADPDESERIKQENQDEKVKQENIDEKQ